MRSILYGISVFIVAFSLGLAVALSYPPMRTEAGALLTFEPSKETLARRVSTASSMETKIWWYNRFVEKGDLGAAYNEAMVIRNYIRAHTKGEYSTFFSSHSTMDAATVERGCATIRHLGWDSIKEVCD